MVMNVLATDQLGNRREAIYSLGGPHGADVSIFGNILLVMLHVENATCNSSYINHYTTVNCLHKLTSTYANSYYI